MAATDLPLDIIRIIFLNLRVKSLLRFKTVCKSWNYVISDPRFIKLHRERFKNSNPHNLFICKRISQKDELSLFKFGKGELEFIELAQQPHGKILCSGDGLVLLGNNSTCTEGNVYGLWDPLSGKHAPFWCPYRWVKYGTIHGLCRDPDLDDYKVVINYEAYYAVFSCKNKTWTKKRRVQYYTTGMFPLSNAGLYVDGFLFWVSRDEDNYHTKDIIYFDARDEEFKKLQKPELLEGVKSFYLTSVAGFLCVYHHTIRPFCTSRSLQMWIMKGHVDSYSWSKLQDIEIMGTSYLSLGPLMPMPMFFSEKNERVTNTDKFEHIMSSGTIETLATLEHGIRSVFPVAPHVESLFFPIQYSTGTKRKRSSCMKLNAIDDGDDDYNK